MQLTTLLDTVYQGVSTTGADDFDRLVADLIPCRTHDPELWFAEHTAQVEQAKALCRTCPVREGCLALPDPKPLDMFEHVYVDDHPLVDAERREFSAYLESFADHDGDTGHASQEVAR